MKLLCKINFYDISFTLSQVSNIFCSKTHYLSTRGDTEIFEVEVDDYYSQTLLSETKYSYLSMSAEEEDNIKRSWDSNIFKVSNTLSTYQSGKIFYDKFSGKIKIFIACKGKTKLKPRMSSPLVRSSSNSTNFVPRILLEIPLEPTSPLDFELDSNELDRQSVRQSTSMRKSDRIRLPPNQN